MHIMSKNEETIKKTPLLTLHDENYREIRPSPFLHWIF